MWLNIPLFIALLLTTRRFIFKTITLLHIFQLEGYRNKRFIKWALKNPKKAFDKESFITGIGLIFIGLFLESFKIPIVFPILWIFMGIWLFRRCKRPKQKKPLVWTGRLVRLFSLCFFIWLFILSEAFYLTNFSIIIPFLVAFILLQLIFVILSIANILALPIERSINLYYLIKAERKIRKIRPKVIGITGSYGKTSVKYIIGKILSKTYNTLITPESYNTLMGICKVINEHLKEEHQVFVVEMGAYKRGDIKELCRLVKPEIGVLTGITFQHLERFKTLENIKLAKFEIIENLPPSGIAIVNNDDEHCRELIEKVKIKSLRYGIEPRGQDVIAEDIEIDTDGAKFIVSETPFKTRLFGRHNVLNILAGICVGIELSIDMEKIKEAIAELDFIPHRLQLIKEQNNVFILDDSYNSNPIGAYEALSCLSLFKDKRKILVTPGMIELSFKGAIENKKFGKASAKICDIVILVGEKRTRPIFDGLKEGGFKEENIIVVDSLDSAKEKLKMIIRPNDCILFENDLPDLYGD